MDMEHGHSTCWRSQALAVEAGTARRRGNGIFCSASVAHVDDDEDDVFGGVNVVSAKVCRGEKLLLNGDYYAGDWLGRLPHGHGKYLWSDGCMYDGEWYKGRTMGKGRFCWPSGATYEGQFSDGFMDGVGTYTAPSGDTYTGSWSRNMKHGHGTKTFVKGDVYEGEWKLGSWHGHGRYRWKNGNCYIGQWKNGMINGKGAMIWSNGNRYDGFWEDGLPKGMGTFRLADGSCYDRWNEDTRKQRWAYRASVSQDSNNIGEDPLETLKGNDDFVRPRKTSVDCHSQVGMPGGCRQLRIGRINRQGEMISKGHKNYELMLNLQLGIRHSVSRPTPVNSLDLTPSAFDPKEKMRTRFPPEGSKNTPPHQSCEFRWKDYCPVVFRALRKLFEIDVANYMISLCGDDALREISSPGKSGSFFYLTNDDQYMIKTIKKAEVKALLRMLPAYYEHVQKYHNTLLTKFFGLHCVKLTGATQKKVKADVFRQRAPVSANFNLVMSLQVRFVVMGNLFCSQNTIHQCFDLKGSSQGRVTEKPETDIHTTAPLKDLDLNFLFRLQKQTFQEFRRQVDIDCDFLKRERIMDYSLLIGLHFRNTTYESDMFLARPINSQENTVKDEIFSSRARYSRPLGVNMLARAELTGRPEDGLWPAGRPIEEMYDVSISLGIIDILQDYDINKKLEHAYKAMQYDATLISAVDPRQYSRRFCDFIFKVFVEDI